MSSVWGCPEPVIQHAGVGGLIRHISAWKNQDKDCGCLSAPGLGCFLPSCLDTHTHTPLGLGVFSSVR